MSQYHAKIVATDLKFPEFLENYPNLESLVVEFDGSPEKKEQITFSYVPRCMVSSLESVEILTPIAGIGVEMELIRYFLENSKVLKKLTLRLEGRSLKEESMIFMELLRFRRCSSACGVHVVGLEDTMLKL